MGESDCQTPVAFGEEDDPLWPFFVSCVLAFGLLVVDWPLGVLGVV